MTFETELFYGRVCSLAAHGQTMTLAKPGTFRLVPKAERLPALRRDYQLMRDMYLTEPVSFDDILTTLSNLEHRINLRGHLRGQAWKSAS